MSLRTDHDEERDLPPDDYEPADCEWCREDRCVCPPPPPDVALRITLAMATARHMLAAAALERRLWTGVRSHMLGGGGAGFDHSGYVRTWW